MIASVRGPFVQRIVFAPSVACRCESSHRELLSFYFATSGPTLLNTTITKIWFSFVAAGVEEKT